MQKNEVLGKILYTGFLPVVIYDRLPVLSCIARVVEAGIEAVEISCRHPQALSLIQQAKKEFPDLAVGAASLIEDGKYRDFIVASGHPLPSIEEVVDVGCDLLVSMLPFREHTYTKYSDTHVIMPGVATPGQAHQALDWGANLVKFVNPKLLGGPTYFRSIDAATHRGLPIFVTGGIRPEIISDYIEANVLVVGAGFDLILDRQYVAMQEDFNENRLLDALKEYVAAVETARQEYQPHIPFAGKDPVAIAAASGRCLNAQM